MTTVSRMINNRICLDANYSTTKLLSRETYRLNSKSKDSINQILFLPEKNNRQGEGGLRTNGYFKETLKGTPLITVVMAVFNGQSFIEDAILSVINQTYDNVEYIIIDGGSTDKSVELIKKYEHAIDYWVSEKDDGIYDAWNKAISISRGDWVSFLGSDDMYVLNALDWYVEDIILDDDIRYISSKVNLISDNKIVRTIGQNWCWNRFKKYMNVAHVGSLHHRSLFEDNGVYDSTLKIVADYEFLMRVGEKLNAGFLDKVTAEMRVGGASDGKMLGFLEVAKIKIRHNISGKIAAYAEAIFSKIKWMIRKALWY